MAVAQQPGGSSALAPAMRASARTAARRDARPRCTPNCAGAARLGRRAPALHLLHGVGGASHISGSATLLLARPKARFAFGDGAPRTGCMD